MPRRLYAPILLLIASLAAMPADADPPDAAAVQRWLAQLQQGGVGEVEQARIELWLQRPQGTSTEAGDLDLVAARQRIRLALAQQARRQGDVRQMAVHLDAIRSEAWRLRRDADRHAEALGEYWLLLTDLMSTTRLARSPLEGSEGAARRVQEFIDRLTRFGGAVPAPAGAVLRDARLALLALRDDQGRTGEVVALRRCLIVEQGLNAKDPRLAATGYAEYLGQPVAIDTVCIDGTRWRSSDHLGKPVVLLFWAGPGMSGGVEDRLSAARPAVLVLDLSRSEQSGLVLPTLPWPTVRQPQAVDELVRYLSIHSLPRLAVLNSDGRLAAVGGGTMAQRLGEVLKELPSAEP